MMGVDAALCAVGMGEELKQLLCKKVSGWSLNVEKRRNSRILRQVFPKSQIWKDASMAMLREGAVAIESPR